MLLWSCEKEETFAPVELAQAANSTDGFYQYPEIPYGPGPTRLGRKLSNPYNLDNVRRAAQLLKLTGDTGEMQKSYDQLEATHVYVKMTPQTGEAYVHMMELAERYGVTFQEEPFEYEVLHQGEEGYRDPAVGQQDIPPVYGAVPVDVYGKGFDEIGHEVIEQLHIPVYETQLTFAAYVISGNEQDYEAIEGFCHPDCPNWPACLDEPELACTPDVAPGELPTLFPGDYGEERENFPAYIQDAGMGLEGEVQPFAGLFVCDVVTNPRPNCPDGYNAVLNPIDHEPGACRWECRAASGGGGGGGSDPTASTCGCRTSFDRRSPGGKMILEDTQLGDEGVRRAKVRATRYRWGYIWTDTDTDDDGCWSINRTYGVDRGMVQIVFKDRTSNRMVIRSLRGARVHNAFLEAVDYTWYLTRDDGRWNNLCLRITDDRSDNSSLREQTFIAASTNNAVHEYYDDHARGAPSPGKISVLIHTLDDRLDAAPMFRKIDQARLSPIMLDTWFAAYISVAGVPPLLRAYWEVAKPDVFIAFGDGRSSDVFKRTVYHEMVHTSQFVKVGQRWWRDNIIYLGNVFRTKGQPAPYGNGDVVGSGKTEVIEGMAQGLDNRFAAQQYGVRHSRNTSVGRSYYDIIGEAQKFWNARAQFIPAGLFYDLLDNNARRYANVGFLNEATGISDQVDGIGFERQLRALNSQVESIHDYEGELIRQEQGTVSASAITSLFVCFIWLLVGE